VSDSEFIVRLQARAADSGRRIGSAQARELEKFYGLLAKWNRRINLTALDLAPLPAAETLDRLFIEPLIASELVPTSPLVAVDLGSGSGSPALPLKIFRPAARLTLVETRGRKAAFLREAVRALGFRDVDVEQTRFQSLPASLSSEFDIAVVRGLRLDDELLGTVVELLRPSGRLITFGAPQDLPGFAPDDSRPLPDGSQVASWAVLA
jgi:16S rRNA (guanine527-N7)-methyltransferase